MKKKISILIILTLLTGCLGETGKGYITKTCKKHEKINGNDIETIVEIKSKQGIIETITIKETYDKNVDLENIIDSKKSEQNLFKQTTGATLEIKENSFIYQIDKKEASELIIKKYNILKEQHEQIKYYEKNGYSCK